MSTKRKSPASSTRNEKTLAAKNDETSLATSYFGESYTTLQMAVADFERKFELMFPSGNVGMDEVGQKFNQGVHFAGTMLSILPVLILYAFTQKWFVESADRAGIAGS